LINTHERNPQEELTYIDKLTDKEHLERLFSSLVEFVYTGDIDVKQDSPDELLFLMILADSFQILDLKKR
jgi:hypothetical protein